MESPRRAGRNHSSTARPGHSAANRSDFMLEAACREAEGILLDRRYFALPAEEFKRFTAMLDKPPASNPRLARLLKTRAPWDK